MRPRHDGRISERRRHVTGVMGEGSSCRHMQDRRSGGCCIDFQCGPLAAITVKLDLAQIREIPYVVTGRVVRAVTAVLLSTSGFSFPYATRRNWPMKLTTIALASAFALSGTFAFAQAGGPNGTAGGPTSLSGTGPSTSGGDSPGAVGRNTPAAGGSMSGGTTGSAVGNQPCDSPNGCPGGPTSLSGTGSSQFGGSTPGGPGRN
jgi:hypothetical protein